MIVPRRVHLGKLRIAGLQAFSEGKLTPHFAPEHGWFEYPLAALASRKGYIRRHTLPETTIFEPENGWFEY